MPELPEVETLVRRLREPVIGRTIEDVAIFWKRTVARPAPQEFARLMRGCTVQAIDRRAKYLVFTLIKHPAQRPPDAVRRTRPVRLSTGESGASWGGRGRNDVTLAPQRALGERGESQAAPMPTLFLLIHLKMSGKLSVADRGVPIEKHDRVVFGFDNGLQLRFNDVRKFGKMWAVMDPEQVTGSIGPEPLDTAFGLPKFRALVQSRSGIIKPLLLNQTFLAGVGNIYADESLWRARIHPLRTADSLSDPEIAALYRSIRHVLQKAIEHQGTDAGDGVIEGDYAPRVYGREGQPCYRCHQPLHKIEVGQRGTHFCPRCQPKPRRASR